MQVMLPNIICYKHLLLSINVRSNATCLYKQLLPSPNVPENAWSLEQLAKLSRLQQL